MELNKIYNEDCLDTMSMMPNEFVDLCYADPPFNTGNKIGWYNRKYNGRGNDKLSPREYVRFCKAWFREARRVSKKLVITPGVGNVGLYPNPFWVIVISKPSSPSFNRCGGFNCWEPLFIYNKPIQKLPRDVVVYDSLNHIKDGREKHPCPDNDKMVDWIINMWSIEGDLVYDPFIGSGTTAISSIKYKRNWIGSEISLDYCELAEKRIAPYLMQQTMNFG